MAAEGGAMTIDLCTSWKTDLKFTIFRVLFSDIFGYTYMNLSSKQTPDVGFTVGVPGASSNLRTHACTFVCESNSFDFAPHNRRTANGERKKKTI